MHASTGSFDSAASSRFARRDCSAQDDRVLGARCNERAHCDECLVFPVDLRLLQLVGVIDVD